MEPFTMIALGAGAYLMLRKSKTARRGARPIIRVAPDCSSWDIPDEWYGLVGAPKYVQLVAAYPESIPLETRVSRISESMLIGETGQCVVKDVPNLSETMRGLLDQIGEYVRDGLQNGGNPFLPGLARYVVASEVADDPAHTAIIVVRRPPQGPSMSTPASQAYAWGTGKYGVTLSQILTLLGTLSPDNDDPIEQVLAHFGYASSIDAALTKARQTAMGLGPIDSVAPGQGILFG